jgi:hypothetical protein
MLIDVRPDHSEDAWHILLLNNPRSIFPPVPVLQTVHKKVICLDNGRVWPPEKEARHLWILRVPIEYQFCVIERWLAKGQS